MKMVGKSKTRVAIFETQEGILLDNNLPKYQKLRLPKDDEVDPDQIIYENMVMAATGKTNPEEVKSYSKKDLEKFLGNTDSEKFNIYLTESLKKSVIDSRLSVFQNNNFIVRGGSFEALSSDGYGAITSKGEKEKKNRFNLFKWLKKKKEEEIKEKTYTLNVLSLFDEVKLISGKERVFINRLEEYVGLINKAQSLGQVAQTEELVEKLVVHIYESILATSRFNKYIDEKDLITLQGKCEKQLDLDYIKNFNRVIPDTVAEKKLEADKLLVFDNYVVLYYDPTGKSYRETVKEVEAKKDPILFGVIKGSNKLYYIDSWIDEYCDLTWDELVNKLNEEKTL